MAAKMYDGNLYERAGIKYFSKYANTTLDTMPTPFKDAIRDILAIRDEQDAIEAITWYNTPDIEGERIEKYLYEGFSIIQFYYKPLDKFLYMPFAIEGVIDYYGRATGMHPLPWAQGQSEDSYKKAALVFSTYKLKPIYTIEDAIDAVDNWDTYEKQGYKGACVVICDYTSRRQTNGEGIPRMWLNEKLIDMEAEIYPYARTALRNATGICGLGIEGQDSNDSAIAMNESLDKAALNGQKYLGLTAKAQIQELVGGNTGAAQDFLLTMESIDNFRISTHGMSNGGIFEKKAHMLQSEANMNAGVGDSVLANKLYSRQLACAIATILWGTGQSCEASEVALKIDANMDGKIDNGSDQGNNTTTQSGGEQNDSND